jgi:7,8-dihydropterin-6-yl-methyl-4-(beta-D-ribofuranosyl)aminobenzene 5'-phosphate synthase
MIEVLMRGKLTILCENTVNRPGGLVGEHGFACLLETDQGRYLFDTGQGLTIINNARLLGKDLAALDGIVLSHGHADHSGGLPQVLAASGPLPVYAHPGIFSPRCWAGRYERRPNGCPFGPEDLRHAGGRLEAVRTFGELVPGFLLSGEVPRSSRFETGDPNLMVAGADGQYVPDPFLDDLSLALDTPRGLLVVVGCAHAGLVNILRHFQTQTGGKSIFAVIGGTHLAPADDDQMAATIDFLRFCGIERLGLSHCTGLGRGGELAQIFPGRVVFANVGFHLDF